MSEWKKVKIGEFLKESKVLAEESDAAHRITVRLNCKGVEKRGLKAEKEGATKYYTRYAGQFIYGKQNIHKGAFGIIPPELDGFTSSADLPAFDIDESKCVPEWIPLCLKVDERYKTLQKEVKGVGSQRLAVNVFLNVEIPLPDVNVQRKILAKVSKKITSITLLDDEIEKQKNYAKQLRQNILQEAIEGKLTADWRKQHPVQKGNPDYDAQALLDCLQQKKESLKKDPLVKREKIRTPVSDTEKEFSIPNNWIWIRMGELCYPITKGTTPDVHEIKADGEIPYLKMFNIVNQKLDFDYRPQYISKKVHDEKLTRSKVYPNDVIMNIVGPPMGKIAMVTDEFPEWNLNQAMAIFRGYDISINPYIYVFLNSMIWFKYVHTLGVVGQENMSLEQCKDIAIPLPPLAEQKEIVARVEQHLQTITQLETQIATRETTTKQLMQSILKDAFEED